MENYSDQREVFSQKVRAGKRTYIFDVRATRGSDYYITITERKKKITGDGFHKNKIFLYKEDFNKFISSLNEVVNYVKTELLPDYNFEEFDKKRSDNEEEEEEWDYDV